MMFSWGFLKEEEGGKSDSQVLPQISQVGGGTCHPSHSVDTYNGKKVGGAILS